MYATFSTSRRRSAFVAPIATLLVVGFAPRDFDFSRYPVLSVVFDLLFVALVVIAVRAWIGVVRPQAELRMTAEQVPVPRRPNGSFRVLPIGRGRTTTRRLQDLGRFSAAVMGFGGRYLDPV